MPGSVEADDQERLGDLGERRILSQLLAPRYQGVEGFGDDCAVLTDELVVTTDACPTPLMAQLGHDDLYHAGWLLATINLSDLAAAGAEPLGLVVNYTLPAQLPVADFERLVDGVDDCARAHGTKVVGGDVRDGSSVQLSATAIGRCEPGRRLSRRGAKVDDHLLLVGSPGWLWAAVLLHEGYAHLSDAEHDLVIQRACRPWAQLEAGKLLAGHGLARSAMDVSDGLYASVRALCDANGLGARMNRDVELDPVLAKVCAEAEVDPFDLAQTWGDWSLLVAVAPTDADTAIKVLVAAGIGVRDIGTLVMATDGIGYQDGDRATPWHGVDQERFSHTSWHGGSMEELTKRLLNPNL
jgi:thiamine-monophosphate kinase